MFFDPVFWMKVLVTSGITRLLSKRARIDSSVCHLDVDLGIISWGRFFLFWSVRPIVLMS